MIIPYVMMAIIILAILLWCVAIKTMAPTTKRYLSRHHPPMVSVEKLLREADSGDLIFFSGDSDAEKAIRLYTGAHFNHVALVIREVDEHGISTPYLLEADVGGTHRTGVRVIELERKLEGRDGVIGWRRLVTLARPTAHDIVMVARALVGLDMDRSMMCWLFSDYPASSIFRYFRPKDDVVFCSELVAIALGRLGILSEKENSRHPSSFSPGDFAFGRVDLAKGYVYSESFYCDVTYHTSQSTHRPTSRTYTYRSS